MQINHPLIGVLLILLTLVGSIVALRWLNTHRKLNPELSRKLLHIAMGVTALSFPWLFADNWPVIILAIIASVTLLMMRLTAASTAGWSNVIHGVVRTSYGDFCFPLAVAVVFLLAKDQPLFYVTPILLLTLADAVAALIGVYYGNKFYDTGEGYKSIEGTIAFFIVAFFSVHIPLLLFTDVGRAETLLISLIIASLVMLVEGSAWRGLDNLFIPIGGYELLVSYIDMPLGDLLVRLVAIILIMILIIGLRKKSTLIDSAVLGVTLAAYFTWSVGGWPWLVAPILLLISYTILALIKHPETGRIHTIYAVLCVSIPGFIWLLFSKTLHEPHLLYNYTVCYGVQMAMIGVARNAYVMPNRGKGFITLISAVQAWVIIVVPFMIYQSTMAQNFILPISAFFLLYAGALVFYMYQPKIHDCPVDSTRWWRQASVSTVISVISLVPLRFI